MNRLYSSTLSLSHKSLQKSMSRSALQIQNLTSNSSSKKENQSRKKETKNFLTLIRSNIFPCYDSYQTSHAFHKDHTHTGARLHQQQSPLPMISISHSNSTHTFNRYIIVIFLHNQSSNNHQQQSWRFKDDREKNFS